MKTKFIRLVSFVILFAFLFVQVSYFIRPTNYFIQSVKSLKKEKVDIDVLCIGGSSTYVYWIPMIAYEDYGISSYNYSESAMHPGLIKGLLEESYSMCSPKLYVIDIRGFEVLESRPETYNIGGFQTYTCAFPYGKKRFDMIHYAYPFVQFDASELSLHLDLLINHSSLYQNIYANIKNDYNTSTTKGAYIEKREYANVPLNDYSYVTGRKELKEDTKKILTDLLDYIKDKDLPVLFLINAYSFSGEEERSVYNSISDVINEYGYSCLDTNLHYDEIGLDGSTDFYNVNHVNALGAEKYTKWLSSWLKDNYDLKDRSEEENFNIWNEQSKEFDKIWIDLKEYYLDLLKEKGVTYE